MLQASKEEQRGVVQTFTTEGVGVREIHRLMEKIMGRIVWPIKGWGVEKALSWKTHVIWGWCLKWGTEAYPRPACLRIIKSVPMRLAHVLWVQKCTARTNALNAWWSQGVYVQLVQTAAKGYLRAWHCVTNVTMG